jgi:hypothetical protein
MEIKISKSSRKCAACDRDFVHEEPLFSLIRVTDREFVREDFCQDCWNKERGEGSYSFWSLKYYDASVADQQPEEAFSPLRQTFYEAVESAERTELAKAYLAAQMLRRQKVFRLIKESGDAEGELQMMLYVDRIGNRLIEVRDPSLTYAELEDGRKALLKRLIELETAESQEES